MLYRLLFSRHFKEILPKLICGVVIRLRNRPCGPHFSFCAKRPVACAKDPRPLDIVIQVSHYVSYTNFTIVLIGTFLIRDNGFRFTGPARMSYSRVSVYGHVIHLCVSIVTVVYKDYYYLRVTK